MNPKLYAILLLPLVAAWCLLTLIGKYVTFVAQFSVWAMSLVIGLGCTAIYFLYRHEGSMLPKMTAAILVTLRCLAYTAVALMLMQPVLIFDVNRRIERTVAVAVDTSGSMLFNDTEWNDVERLSLAREAGLLGEDEVLIPSLERFDEIAGELRPWTVTSGTETKLPASFRDLVTEAADMAEAIAGAFAEEPLKSSTSSVFRAYSRQLTSSAIPVLKEAKHLSPSLFATFFKLDDSFTPEQSAAILLRLGESISAVREMTPEVRREADALVWERLPETRRDDITAYVSTNRLHLAVSILGNSLAEKLSSRYGVKYYALSRSVTEIPTEGASFPATNFAAYAETPAGKRASFATDLTTSLEKLTETIPSEQLAGILLLSDGLHNGDASPEPAARRIGARGVRVSSVLVGSSAAPFDLALTDISAPESVFLGDKVRVRATLSATCAAGKTAHIRLLKDGEQVDETEMQISGDAFRREFSLVHEPGTNGLSRYELAIDGLEGERFPSNNTWKVDVAVSDDRTNVLLIDDYPRWDFRYLRNLFYARDKSVHLQYYLVHPDTIADIETTNKPPAACASRPFGEAEAGALPVSADEWKKFDVIIAGDVGPDVLTPEVQSNILECVSARGSLFVSIAGPRAMPHAYGSDSPLLDLLPYSFASADTTGADYWKGPEKAFNFSLTPSGRIHPVAQQSGSITENEHIWNSLPRFAWRFPVDKAKPGAEIIAVAEPVAALAGQVADNIADDEPVTLENAAEHMEKEREKREKTALVIAQNFGRGKSLALTTDESWRLRYRKGDVLHHRFWGQVIRWGLGERLRNGTRQLRVGTDKMTYTPGDSVRILARVYDKDFSPVNDASLKIEIERTDDPVQAAKSAATDAESAGSGEADGAAAPEADGVREEHKTPKTVATLQPVDESGLYEVFLPPFHETGAYRVRILDPDKYSGEAGRDISTSFFVTSERRPVEMARVASDASSLSAIAKWTGGKVVTAHEAASLADSFGEPSRTVTEQVEIALWDRPWLYLTLAGLIAAEWILRKRRGLV